MDLAFHHQPVLLNECMDGLAIRPDGIYVDGTVGGGGHAREIARRLTTGMLIGIDKDPAALAAAAERLQEYPAKVIRGDFKDLSMLLDSLSIDAVDGVLLDLGVSSHQLDTPERGFSYHNDAPLDMRMSGEGESAFDLVNHCSREELTAIFRRYGEERFAFAIASNIEKARATAPISTTGELVEIIKSSIPAPARRTGGHPAKRVFQALRIAVNTELDSLEEGLQAAFERLRVNGRLAVISFHSLEDRMVKRFFAELATGCDCPPDFPICVCGKTPRAKHIGKRPIVAGEQERQENNRSRSAKLRVVEKLA